MGASGAPSRKYGWISLAAGTVITSVLGTSYAYSVYKSRLEALWGSSFWAALPFSVLIALFAFTSIVGGRLYSKLGIRAPSLASMILVSVSFLLSSLVEVVTNPLYMVISYGVLSGLGNGLGYVPIIAMARKWFPDRAGLATGIVIFGYGGSAAAFAPIKRLLLEIQGLGGTLVIMGVISLVLGIPAALVLRDPKPEVTKYFSAFSKRRAIMPKQELGPEKAVRTPDLWLLWLSFLLVSGAGLMMIGHLARFAETRGLEPAAAALLVSIFSVTNALGRPPAGWISDRLGKYGRPVTMTIFFVVQSVLFMSLAYIGYSALELYAIMALAGFVYGSALALYPAATGDFFGLRSLSENYAIVFTGWGVAGLLFPALGGYLKDVTGGYELALMVSGAISLAGALMCLYLKGRLKLYLE